MALSFATESGSVFVQSTVNSSSVPSIADEPDAGEGDPGDDPENDPPTGGDDPTDEPSDEEDSGLPGLDWTTTGTSTDTFHFTSNFSRTAAGIYTDGNMSGTATQLITINAHSNRTASSELSGGGTGEAEWAVTVGSGDSGSLYDSTFNMDASGPTTDGLLSGTATIGQFSHSHDSTDRTDTYDTAASKWASTGTRTTSANSTSNNGLDVSGDEASTAGGSPITATRTLTLDNDSSFDQATTQTLVLRDDDEGESDPGSDAYEWAISEGTRHSSTGSILTNAIAGTGSVSKQVGSVTLDYTLERDDSTTSDNETKLSYIYDTQSDLWIGGGYQSEILDVVNSDTAHAMTIYTITNPDGGGTGQASHDRTVTNTVHYDNKTAIDTAPITMNMPELSGTYTSTHSLSNSVRNQTGSTLAADTGGGSPAVGSINTLLLTHFGYSQTYDMDRSAGDTEWSDSGSMTTETSHTNNFDSTLAGDWASQPGGGIGALEGAMSSSVVNHNTVSYVSSGPLNEQGGYDLTTVSTNNFDHQNISSYSGVGSYDTIDHEVPISGVISYSRDDTVIHTQNLTTTTAPDGTRTVVGDGRIENTHDSTRSADGGGSVNEHTTWETGLSHAPNTLPWSGSTTHEYWNVRHVNQSYDRAASYSTVDTYGVIGNVYTLLQHDDNSYSSDNNDSTVDIMTRTKTSGLFTRPNGDQTETLISETDSTSHRVSNIHTTDTKTDNQSTDHADPSNSISERSGSRTRTTDQTTSSDSYSLHSVTNSSQGSDYYNESYNHSHSTDDVDGTVTYGDEASEDAGSTHYTGTVGHTYGYRTDASAPFDDYDMYHAPYNGDYDTTVAYNDDNAPPVPQARGVTESSTPPITHAAPSVSAPSENPHAATDQAISELTQNDAAGGSPYASTAESPVELLAGYTGPIGDVGGRGDLAERFPESAAPPAPQTSPETPPQSFDLGFGSDPEPWTVEKPYLGINPEGFEHVGYDESGRPIYRGKYFQTFVYGESGEMIQVPSPPGVHPPQFDPFYNIDHIASDIAGWLHGRPDFSPVPVQPMWRGVPIKIAVMPIIGGARAPRGGALSGQTLGQARTTLTTAAETYKGSTRLGHALSKHAGRNPNIWGKITGSPATYHDQALKHLREIYRASGEFKRVTNSNGVTFLEKMLPDGRGIRLQLDHVFKGFID